MIKIFYNVIMRKDMSYKVENGHLCVLADKASDLSNFELLSLVMHQVTSQFVVEEYLLDFYKLDIIKAEYVAKYIK